jgi:hypothetical protein
MTGTVKSHPKWNFNRFMCFLLMHAAEADLEFSEAECDMIKKRIDEAAMNEIREELEANNDYERLQIIQSYKDKYFPTPEKKAALLVRIEELFEIDGTYSQTEHNLFMMLRKIL